MSDSDAECVSAYKAGNPSALETLYWRHAERVWRYARYFSGSDELAAEIVQETFIRVATHLKAFEGRSQFSTWLFAIVRSVSIDQAAKRRRAPVNAETESMDRVPATTPEPSEDMAGAETRAAVRAAIARLPENEREAVLLCEIEDMPLRAAGEILGWGEGRVKVTLFRARRRLKDMLASHVGATK